MIALLQRVSVASVSVAGNPVAAIARGLLVFVGVEREDDEAKAERLAARVLSYRVFGDASGKMNLNVQDVGGSLLLVPQFTLAADTAKGTRASFTPAAPPDIGRRLFDHFSNEVRRQCPRVATGTFGAEMQVTLTNEGPVTFWLTS